MHPTDAAFSPLYAPFKADYKFGKILPNVGFTYSVDGPSASSAATPRASRRRAPTTSIARPSSTLIRKRPTPSTLALRYTKSKVQAQATVWKIDYKNRIVTSFNPDLGISIDRNVGKVNS